MLRGQILTFQAAEVLTFENGQNIAAFDAVAQTGGCTGDNSAESRYYAHDTILIELDFTLQLQC